MLGISSSVKESRIRVDASIPGYCGFSKSVMLCRCSTSVSADKVRPAASVANFQRHRFNDWKANSVIVWFNFCVFPCIGDLLWTPKFVEILAKRNWTAYRWKQSKNRHFRSFIDISELFMKHHRFSKLEHPWRVTINLSCSPSKLSGHSFATSSQITINAIVMETPRRVLNNCPAFEADTDHEPSTLSVCLSICHPRCALSFRCPPG